MDSNIMLFGVMTVMCVTLGVLGALAIVFARNAKGGVTKEGMHFKTEARQDNAQ